MRSDLKNRNHSTDNSSSAALVCHRRHPFRSKFSTLVRLMKIALVAIPLFAIAVALKFNSPTAIVCCVLSALAFVPFFIYVYVLTILHWKGRYRGRHSDLWGTLLLLETSGWFKLIYIFRHILPDMKGAGRYRNADGNA
jgi:hypothetical protein